MVNHLQLKASDNVYLVSDVSRLMMTALQHHEKFDPAQFISSFTDQLTDGNLLIPGFVNTLSNEMDIDMRTLKPETGGLSKEAFNQFKKGGPLRTNDPFHSFFVFGRDGKKITDATNENVDTFGKNSVFGYLHQNGGVLIMIDLPLYFGFTFAHYVEQQEQVSYRRNQPFHFQFTDTSGNTSKKTFNIYAKKRGYDPLLNSLEKLLEDAGALQRITFNTAVIFRIDLQKAYEVVSMDIINNGARNIIHFKFSLYLKQTIKKITG